MFQTLKGHSLAIKPLLVWSIFICFIFCSSACKKGSTSYFMKATVNGVQFTGNNAISYLVGSSVFLNGGPYYDTLFLYPIISFGFVTTSLTPATYPIENFKLNVWVDSLHVNPLPAAYGVVNITSVSPDIVGTFSFTCTDSTKVTNGSFVAKHY